MKIVDANVLIYAYNTQADLHKEAMTFWEDLVNSGSVVGVPWIVLQAFVRLMTGRQVLTNPFTATEIVDVVDSWFENTNVQLLPHTLDTYRVFSKLVVKYKLTGSITTDCTIVASVIENQGVLYSNDTDFLRFREVKLENPFG